MAGPLLLCKFQLHYRQQLKSYEVSNRPKVVQEHGRFLLRQSHYDVTVYTV